VRVQGEWESREVLVEEEWLDPRPSQAIRNHSPDGFNWSYGGSGPAQLALAVLMKFMPAEDAQGYYQLFKFDVIAALPRADFDITINLKEKINHYKQNRP